jgi:tryptophan-rich sensory protein
MKVDWKRLIIAILISYSAAFIGSAFTFTEINGWYETLVRPAITPPNWLFGPMWTTLYTLIGISLYCYWQKKTKEDKKIGYVLFSIQLFLNALWSIIFFGLHELVFGLITIIFLWFFILFTIIEFKSINKKAAYLMIPYLAWVTAATILNFSIAWLN